MDNFTKMELLGRDKFWNPLFMEVQKYKAMK